MFSIILDPKYRRNLRALFYSVEPVHNFYRQQFRCAPPGVSYVPSSPQFLNESFSEGLRVGTVEKRALRMFDPFAALGIPLVRPTPVFGVDLVHSGQVLLASNKPWVVDFEQAMVFGRYSPKRCMRPRFQNALSLILGQKNCKKLIPWSEASKQSMKSLLGDCGKKVMEKAEVVYPTVAFQEKVVRKERKKLELLFVGKFFYQKGGMETLKAGIELSKRYDVNLTMISKFPPEVFKKYSQTPGIRLVQSSPTLSDADIADAYRAADVFVYPTHMDNLGFVILEAFSYGLPVVSVTEFAVPELVEHGKRGLLVQNPYSDHGPDFLKAFEPSADEAHPLFHQMANPPQEYVKKIAGSIAELLDNGKMRKRMGDAAYSEVASGKFSCKERGKSLRRIYDEAL